MTDGRGDCAVPNGPLQRVDGARRLVASTSGPRNEQFRLVLGGTLRYEALLTRSAMNSANSSIDCPTLANSNASMYACLSSILTTVQG